MSPASIITLTAIPILSLLAVGNLMANRERRKTLQHLIYSAKLHSRQSFSLIVHLRSSAPSLIPLLDHLNSQNYPFLHIMVVIHTTAGKNARGKLKWYKEKHGANLSMIRYRKGLTDEEIVRKYAKNQFILRLEPNDRLSPRFFEVISHVISATKYTNISVRTIPSRISTFSQATQLLHSLVKWTFRKNDQHSRRIWQKDVGKQEQKLKPRVFLPGQYYIRSDKDIADKQLKSYSLALHLLIGLAFLVLYIFAVRPLPSYISTLVMATLILLPAIGTVAVMLGFRGFKIIEYINLFLFTPLSPIYAGTHLSLRFFKQISKRLKTKFTRPKIKTAN